MMRQLVFLSIALTLAAGHAIANNQESNARTALYLTEDESALGSSFVGVAVLKVVRAAWLILSTLWSIVDYKLAAVGFAINSTLWLTKHSVSLVLGAVLMFGFCKFTGFCGQQYLADGILQIVPNDPLLQAESNFNEAMIKYGY